MRMLRGRLPSKCVPVPIQAAALVGDVRLSQGWGAGRATCREGGAWEVEGRCEAPCEALPEPPPHGSVVRRFAHSSSS